MAFTKTFGTASGSWTTATAWKAISVRNPSYSWTLSGSGTNEYYLRTAASGDPGIAAAPGAVWINGASASSGTVGSLAAGTWGYGNTDTLGYSTIYVRLSGGGDPDAQALDHVVFYAVPLATDNVVFDTNSGSVTGGYETNSSEAIGSFRIFPGWQGSIGTSTNYLLLTIDDGNPFEIAGNGTAYINVGGASIAARITSTASASEGEFGLYLKGSALTTISISGNSSVGVAMIPGDTTTATTIAISGDTARASVGVGVTVTNLYQYGGVLDHYADFTTYKGYGGEFNLRGEADVGTITLKGARANYYSSGGVTTLNLYSGAWNEKVNNTARTITNVNYYNGSYNVSRNLEAVTHTTPTTQDSVEINVSP